MQIIKEAIRQITRRHVWLGSLLNRMQYEYDTHGLPTMGTDGKSIVINSKFAATLSAAELQGVLVHEALHVINRHPLRRGNRDPQAFNIACDHAINGIVETLMYRLPGSALEPWKQKTGMDHSAEQIFDIIYPEIEQKRAEQQQQQQAEASESGDAAPQGDPSSDGTDDSTDSQSGESGADCSGSGDSGSSDQSGDSKAAGQSGDSGESDSSESGSEENSGAGEDDSDATSESNSDSGESEPDPVEGNPGNAAENGGADLMDYPLEPGQTMQDADREIDTLIAKAKMDAKGIGTSIQANEQHIFDRVATNMNWLKELEEYMLEHGGSDYSLKPPNKRLSSAGIIANRLNPSGCGNVTMLIDVSGSINKAQLDLTLTNLELFMENIDFESLRIIGFNAKVVYDETFMRGQAFDVSRMPIGGGTRFTPAFDLVAEGAAPDLLIMFSDMEVWAGGAPEDEPDYPVLWVTDNHYLIDEKTGMFNASGGSYAPQWGDIIDTTQ